jgi:hypothetical protein
MSSRAFAQGLQWWLPTAAHLDLSSTQRRQCALVAISGQICLEWLQLHRVKNPKGFVFYL